MLSGLLDTGYREITNLIVGKIYTPAMLGYYNRGNQFPSLIINNFNGSIQSVIFPVLASVQDNKIRVKEITRRAIVTSSYIVFPAMIGLITISEPMIRLILTEK